MLVSHAEAKILKCRRRAQEDRLAAEEAKVLRAACLDVAIKQLSDEIGAYRACPSAKCRRRRGCAGQPLRCNPIVRAHVAKHDIGGMVEEFYWTTLDKFADGRPIDDNAGSGRPS
jgi:hypothetical protein